MSGALYSLSERITSSLSGLAWMFSETGDWQKLSINDYRPVLFSVIAGGHVAGGSAKWMRKKHNNHGIHEPGTIAVLDMLRDAAVTIETIFDIGALYGYFSLISASIFPKAQIYSFEMNRYSFRAMEKNVSVNDNLMRSRIHLVHCALASSTDKNRLVLINNFAVRNLPDCSLLERFKNLLSVAKGFERTVIDCWSLDDFCREYDLKPDLLKIDVEGCQAVILPGAMRTIQECRPIILLEFDDQTAVNATGKSNKDVVLPLIENGYKMVMGNHRLRDSSFREFCFDELNSAHECDGLSMLYPAEKFA